ncbi:MAG: methyltransferase domain-containing protein [Candidatus Cloacimonetes bacterium]|nr:methyltransferase domain-containing protein [Candidatus Cloacimonadota bacterium]
MKPLSDELWNQYCKSLDYDKRIPPPSINYNSGSCDTLQEYLRRHRFDSCARELPFLMNRGGLKKNGHLLDYGCGLGRLAYAAAHYFDSDGMYTGIDINPEAIRFLRDAYHDKKPI